MQSPPEFFQTKASSLLLHTQVWLSVLMVRIRLSRNGYSSFERSPVPVNQNRANVSPRYVSRVVERVSKFVPGALCLAQAVSTQRILAKFGFETVMRIGVKSDDTGALTAHAWLIYQDQVILGGSVSQLSQYNVMTDLTSATTS